MVIPANTASAWLDCTALSDASKPGFVNLTLKPWFLAMALMISTSIPTYLPEPFWYSNGAKDEPIEIV